MNHSFFFYICIFFRIIKREREKKILCGNFIRKYCSIYEKSGKTMQINAHFFYWYLFMPAIEWVLFLLWFWLYILNVIRVNIISMYKKKSMRMKMKIATLNSCDREWRANVNKYNCQHNNNIAKRSINTHTQYNHTIGNER